MVPPVAPGERALAPAADDRRRGILLMVAAMVCIALVDAAAKHLGARLSALQVVWGYYAAFVVAFAAVPSLAGRSWRHVAATRRPGLQILRAAVLIGSLGCLFSALPYLPLADATAISFASPLFVAILSIPLLGERVGPHRWAAVLVGFAGVAIVVRPGAALFQWAALLPLIGAVFFALYQILTRTLARIDDPLTTLLYTGGGGFVLTSLAVGLVWQMPSGADLGVFAIMGVLGVVAHFLIVRAFGLAPAALIAPFNYTRIVWAVLLGFALFGDVPDALSLLGSALIVGSGLYILVRERMAARRHVGAD